MLNRRGFIAQPTIPAAGLFAYQPLRYFESGPVNNRWQVAEPVGQPRFFIDGVEVDRATATARHEASR